MAVNHHGTRQDDSELFKRFREEKAGTAKREYLEGRIHATDEGTLTFMISANEDKELVTIEFGKSTDWIAMNPVQAVEVAQMLIRAARHVSKKPLSIVLH